MSEPAVCVEPAAPGVPGRRRHRWKRRAFGGLAALLLLLNLVAFLHARAMTHFAADGERTNKPELLTLGEKLRVLATGVTLPKPDSNERPDSLGFDFTTHHFESAPGVTLEAWRVSRSAPKGTVLLFHGYGQCKASVLREASAFYGLGYDLCLIDFRGSGGSSGYTTTIGVYEADDVCAAVEFVRKNGQAKRLILFGQSMGAAAILRAIGPGGCDVDAAIVECPFDTLLATAKSRFALMGLPSFPFAQLLVFWGGAQHGFNAFAHCPVQYAQDVRCPVLILHAQRDNYVTVAQVQSIFDNLRGQKELHLFEDLGHERYVVKAAREWRQVVGRFLTEHAHAGRE